MKDFSNKRFKPTIVNDITPAKQRATQRKTDAWVHDKVLSDKTLWDVAVLHSGYGKRDFNTDKLFKGQFNKPKLDEVIEEYRSVDLEYPEGLTISKGADHFYNQFKVAIDKALESIRSEDNFIEDISVDIGEDDYEWGFMEVQFKFKRHPNSWEIDSYKRELSDWRHIKSFEPKILELYEGYLKRNEELKQEERDKRKADLLVELKNIGEE